MKHVRWIAWFFLPWFGTSAHAQSANTDLFCNAGLRPDGYIDLSAMPVAPGFPAEGGAGSVSAAYTVTLPVTGLPGLTVAVTIPPLQSTQGGGPVYSVSNGTLTLNGYAARDAQILLLKFSSPVAGLGLIADSVGRQSDFSLQTDAAGVDPPTFANSADNQTIAPKFYSIPLQQVDLASGFTGAAVVFVGSSGFGTPSVSNLRVQSTVASRRAGVPEAGLEQWLVSESVRSPFAGDASSWPDQSGKEHPATQTKVANQPIPVQGDGNTCQPAFLFAGKQYFEFHLPIDSWQQMTIFLVAKSASQTSPGSASAAGAAIFWNENALWGNTFVTPAQNAALFRFGTTQAGNQPVYSRPLTVGEDFTLTRAVHDGTTDFLYVDGLLAVQQTNRLAALGGTTGDGYLGRGLNNTFFRGEISEVLIYNRVLSTNEAATVEAYLRNKFGLR